MKRETDLEAMVAEALREAKSKDPAYAKQLERVLRGLLAMQYEAPGELIERAKALMQTTTKRIVWAKLFGGSMALAGARASIADNFQLVFEAEGTRTRLLYSKGPKGWEVTGQTPAGFRVEHRGKALKPDAERRIVFHAKKLADTGILLLDNGLEIHIPPADQAEADETPRAD